MKLYIKEVQNLESESNISDQRSTESRIRVKHETSD